MLSDKLTSGLNRVDLNTMRSMQINLSMGSYLLRYFQTERQRIRYHKHFCGTIQGLFTQKVD